MEYIVTHMVIDDARITLRRPILTEEERARRMRLIEEAAIDLILATERKRA